MNCYFCRNRMCDRCSGRMQPDPSYGKKCECSTEKHPLPDVHHLGASKGHKGSNAATATLKEPLIPSAGNGNRGKPMWWGKLNDDNLRDGLFY